MIVSALVRIALFNGPFGSDDTTYLRRAVEISNGVWSTSDYNGALRYGFNIPAGFLIHALGLNVLTATLWPLLCSIAEIAAVYVFAAYLWGRRSALMAGTVLAFIPLHIAVATRLHADPVVSLFLTLSFAGFYFAERTRNRPAYFCTGLALGMVFWVKELAIVTFAAFALYPVLWRKLDARWWLVIGGGALMLVAHLILMTWISGDPLHLFKVVTAQMNHSFFRGQGEDDAWYYFRYLILDVKHTWLAPLAALLGLAGFLASWVRFRSPPADTVYPVFWLTSLLIILSFLPVSLSPLRLVMKQSNYLTLFMAPIALVAGYQIARFPYWIGRLLIALIVTGGLVLAILEQQAYRVFVSNSKAAVKFALLNPHSMFYGSPNNSNIAFIYSILLNDPALANRVQPMRDVLSQSTVLDSSVSQTRFAIVDEETMSWGQNALPISKAPQCWEKVHQLAPTGFGIGKPAIDYARALVSKMPGRLAGRMDRPLESLAAPLPAVVYRFDLLNFWCNR